MLGGGGGGTELAPGFKPLTCAVLIVTEAGGDARKSRSSRLHPVRIIAPNRSNIVLNRDITLRPSVGEARVGERHRHRVWSEFLAAGATTPVPARSATRCCPCARP